jgi:hypothetical protein
MKLYLYPNSDKTDEWRIDIYSNLHEVNRLSFNKKYPMTGFIFINAATLDKHLLRLWFYNVQDEFGTIQDADLSGFIKKMHRYFLWLADMMSRYGEVNRHDTIDKLIELGF